SRDRISVRMTTNLDGMITVIDPKPSRVGLWQRTLKHAQEVYAVRVEGRVPEDMEAVLESPGTDVGRECSLL
ncbi:hypothetical protein EDD16DRAFT_1491635, partial [Pisolithus croceorrhizus]